jgi:chromate transporter
MSEVPSPLNAFPVALPLREASAVWMRIGLSSFGGPAGQIALMHRELVEKRRWISDARFLHALNYCMLLPGPEALQLAIYIGWLLHRLRGGVIAGLCFVLPGLVTILVLSTVYALYGQVPLVAAVFFGLKAAVLAVVVEAVLRIGRRALKTRAMVVIAAIAFLSIFVFAVPFPWIVLVAGMVGLLGSRFLPGQFPAPADSKDDTTSNYLADRLLATSQLPHTQASSKRAIGIALAGLALWWLPVLAVVGMLGVDSVIAQQGLFFSQTAVVTFGGAYAVLAYVAQRVVEGYHWLAPGVMVDGLALAETTPGPLVLVLPFVAFQAAFLHPAGLSPLAAGFAGAALAAWVTFVPSFLFIFLGAPWIEALRRHQALHAALSTITAAVVGVVLNLSVWFSLHTVFRHVREERLGVLHLQIPQWDTVQWPMVVLSVAALFATLRLKIGIGWVLLGAAVLGVASVRLW